MLSFLKGMRALGLTRASNFGGKLAKSLGPKLSVSNRARKNLAACFPEKDPAEIETIISDMWNNLGRTFAEYAHLDQFDAYSGTGHIELTGAENIQKIIDMGRGSIAVSGHFANWELLALALSGQGLSGATVYRKANNPYTDRWIVEQREKNIFSSPIAKGSKGARQLIEILKDKRHIAMLVDQKMNDGISVPFFGREAMTASAAAQLALKFNCPLLPISIVRTEGPNFKMRVYPPIEPQSTGQRGEDIRDMTVHINQWLEERIRDVPSQWLWLHNRWPK